MMALNLCLYKNKVESYPKDVGDFGELIVAKRLEEKGWTCKKLYDKDFSEKAQPADFELFKKDNLGRLKIQRLVEVKSIQHFDFNMKFQTFPSLKLPVAHCDMYDDYSEQRHLPLDLYWVDFREKNIFCQKYAELLIPRKYKDVTFPAYVENWNPPSMFFTVAQFELFDTITDAEYKNFLKIADKYNVKIDFNQKVDDSDLPW